MNNMHFWIVTEQNFEEFKTKFTKKNGSFLFYSISVRDYENLALNMAEIKRYIEQQKEIIIYYEDQITQSREIINTPTNKEKTPEEL